MEKKYVSIPRKIKYLLREIPNEVAIQSFEVYLDINCVQIKLIDGEENNDPWLVLITVNDRNLYFLTEKSEGNSGLDVCALTIQGYESLLKLSDPNFEAIHMRVVHFKWSYMKFQLYLYQGKHAGKALLVFDEETQAGERMLPLPVWMEVTDVDEFSDRSLALR